MKTRLCILAIVVGLQSAWVLGTAFVQERTLAHGSVICLETQPVDPRDLLRGDYVVLNYKISNVPLLAFSPAWTNAVPAGTRVYVLLEQRGQFHEVARASLEPIEPGPGQVVLCGQAGSWSRPSQVHVEYGLERYYVPEGGGNLQGKVTVQAAVPASGAARIKQVFVDGKPYAEAVRRQ